MTQCPPEIMSVIVRLLYPDPQWLASDIPDLSAHRALRSPLEQNSYGRSSEICLSRDREIAVKSNGLGRVAQLPGVANASASSTVIPGVTPSFLSTRMEGAYGEAGSRESSASMAA